MSNKATSLGEEMPKAIKRAQQVRDQFLEMRGMPNILVEPQIAIMTADIDEAVQALASGDLVKMIQAYKNIEDYRP